MAIIEPILPDPPPPTVTTEGGQVIDARGAFPSEGTYNPLTNPGGYQSHRWSGVYGFLFNKIHSDPQISKPGPAAQGFTSGQITLIENFAKAYSAGTMTAWASFVNLLNDRVNTNALWSYLNDIRQTLALASEQLGRIKADSTIIAGTYALVNAGINLANQFAVDLAHSLAVAMIAGDNAVKQYVYNTWAVPLYDLIGRTATSEHQYAQAQASQAKAAAIAHANNLAAMAAGAIAAVSARVASLEQEAADCLDDVCATAGPGTDANKLLKLLNQAQWAAVIAALLALDRKRAEALAAQIAAHGANLGENWVEGFFGL